MSNNKYDAIRRDWTIKPVTRIKQSKKIYNRKKKKAADSRFYYIKNNIRIKITKLIITYLPCFILSFDTQLINAQNSTPKQKYII